MAASNNKKTLLSVRFLAKDFRRPNGTVFSALENINLDVYDGEFLAVLGLSGSGKSTLLRCIAGLLKPDRGQVTFFETPKNNSQLVSMVFQSFALFPWLTVRENIEVAVRSLPRKERTVQVDRMLELVGLAGVEDLYPRELSGGMRQRVSLCRAMVCNPMLMLLDEPFGSLDPLTGQTLRAEIARLWMQAERPIRSCVFVTHSIEEAISLADRIVILSSGPGTIFRIIDVPLKRPRMPSSKDYQDLQDYIEKTFGELHLDKISGETDNAVVVAFSKPRSAQSTVHEDTHTQATQVRKIRPLINTSLVFVEGLVLRLSEETEAMDLYDLCDDMGQSVDQMLPAVASAEMLGFITTPGTQLALTEQGRAFATEQDTVKRVAMLKDACLNLPVLANIYELVKARGAEGLEKSIALEQIVIMLPFEDPDQQFEALVKWGRQVDLLTYDANEELLFVAT